jgi:hypothetical protein
MGNSKTAHSKFLQAASSKTAKEKKKTEGMVAITVYLTPSNILKWRAIPKNEKEKFINDLIENS